MDVASTTQGEFVSLFCRAAVVFGYHSAWSAGQHRLFGLFCSAAFFWSVGGPLSDAQRQFQLLAAQVLVYVGAVNVADPVCTSCDRQQEGGDGGHSQV